MTIRRTPEYRMCRSKVRASGVLLFSLFTACLAPNLLAEETSSASEFEEVVVRAHPPSAEGLAQAASLPQRMMPFSATSVPNLGEVLGTQPGINSSSFGAAVGRPVIHGLGGYQSNGGPA